MTNQKLQPYFLLILIIFGIILAYFIFSPFVQAFVLATVFAVVFQGFHKRTQKLLSNSGGFSAFVSTLIIIVVILVPIMLLGTQLFQESRNIYYSVSSGSFRDNILGGENGVVKNIQKIFPSFEIVSSDIDRYIEEGAGWIMQNLGLLFSSLSQIFIGFFIFAISLYYLLKDGRKFKDSLVFLSPLADTDDESILSKLELAVSSVVKGNLTIALMQGVLTAVGFAIFGVPNFVLWGTVAAISALIPTIGTAIVITPAIIYLFLGGNMFSSIGLLVWGALAVGLIDNLLGPKLVGRNMRMHPLIILFAVLGGISFFGPVGFILGPLVVSFLFALLDIYKSSTKSA